MVGNYLVVLVSASFESGINLFNWLKKYGQTADETYVYLDEFAFTPYPGLEYDAILILNTPSSIIHTCCPGTRTIAFMMEPGNRNEHPWMFHGLEQYAAVYSHMPNSPNTQLSHGFLGWYGTHDLKYFKQLSCPPKTKSISCIASNLKQLDGHRLRLGFVEAIQQQIPGIDFFGKGINFLADKFDGLFPYRYSIAIENASLPFYFTEKINDCFLAWTVPIYYGCTNIGRFFPELSFIQINIHDRDSAITQIKKIMEEDDWESRLEAVREARELVLNKYQPLAGAAQIIRELPFSEKVPVEIKPIKKQSAISGYTCNSQTAQWPLTAEPIFNEP